MLAKEQRLAAAIVFGLALLGWIACALWQGQRHPLPEPRTPAPKQSWEQRRDSIRRTDSARYAHWAAVREQRYDSFRMADSARRAQWKAQRLSYRDSLRRADSLWRDSIGVRFAAHVKKDTLLDLNHCDTTALQYIRGIGPVTAMHIIRYREQLGGYYSPSQLTDEPLAKYRLDTLLHHFTADPKDVQTIPVNDCSTDRLQRHPYLRYDQAKAIYMLRRRQLRLNAPDDLRALPELSEKDIERLRPYLSFD